jgi:putative acetyltransferase
MLKIVLAETDMQYQQVRELFSELSAWDTAQVSRLGLDAQAAMDFYYISGEEELPGVCAPPEGRLFFATCSGKAAGCAALRRMAADTCELKRIYVRPEFRGKQIGRQLAELVILAAIEASYSVMRLETTTFDHLYGQSDGDILCSGVPNLPALLHDSRRLPEDHRPYGNESGEKTKCKQYRNQKLSSVEYGFLGKFLIGRVSSVKMPDLRRVPLWEVGNPVALPDHCGRSTG